MSETLLTTTRPIAQLGRVNTSNNFFAANATVRDDGRVNIHLDDKASRLAKYLDSKTRPLYHNKAAVGADFTKNVVKHDIKYQSLLKNYSGVPKINIAIFIVGSRGDVQPFLAIGQVLSKPPYSHRVRICTHPVFKDFVEENDLEFFSIGGDPAQLMAYMVRNPGLMPGVESLKAGDVGKRRAEIGEMLEGCWRACVEPGNGMGGNTTISLIREVDADQLFVADAIISNPPAYAHIHCAEKLGIPFHMMFTMPWSPTQYFPHPLASMERNDSDPNFANYISYTMMELLAWQGLGDVINGFRTKTLHLDPISPLWGHMLLSRMKVPFTYLWSSSLIPKPLDWGPHIDISGFSFLDGASNYTPPDDIAAFLKAGPPPVYIGFGSIVVDKPEELTKMIFGAVKRVGCRALVSKGWGGLGGNEAPEGTFLLGNCPHDWLFQHVSAVVHHGGAGTTAIGIALGKPTVVVPFFGDQPFWGAMIHRAGAGPEPIAFKKMTEESLAHSISTALEPEIQKDVKIMADKIASEHGAVDAATSFSKSINTDTMRCLICANHVAVWRVRGTSIRLSSFAASVILDNQLVPLRHLKLIKHRDWYVDEGANDPLIGIVAAGSGTIQSALSATVDFSRNMSKSVHKSKNASPASSVSLPVPEETDPKLMARRESLQYVPSRNPVQLTAQHYSPQHVEGVAYRMAAKSLPKRKKSQVASKKPNRSKTWPVSFRLSQEKSRTLSMVPHEHGRVHDAAFQTGHYAQSMLETGLRGPVALFYNMANGFHNAPSFYLSDHTVRRRPPITGLGSGFQAAGKEFGYGLYDGFTGLVTQPYHGAKEDGVVGFGKGVGKGVGGLVFKTIAAVVGIPGYTLKGLERQVEKRGDRGLKHGLILVRLRQGIKDFQNSSEEDRKKVLDRWATLNALA